MRKGSSGNKKKAGKVFFIFCILAALTWLSEKLDPVLKDGDILERNRHGEGSYETELIWSIPEKNIEHEMTVTVEEQGLTDVEEEALLEAAKEEITTRFIGNNLSMEEIRENVFVYEQYQNGQVAAEWSFDSYKFITLDGTVHNEEVKREGELVKAIVELSCGKHAQTYSFSFRICPKDYSFEEKIDNKLKDELTKRNDKLDEKELVLPQTVEGQTVRWRMKNTQTPIKLLLLGIIASCCVPLIEKSRRQEAEKKRNEKLQSEYPELVSKLTILLGAGMTLSGAWNKIATSYLDKRKNNTIEKHPLYEEMLITKNEIESGVGEVKAYERFGERCGLHQYRKFCSLLTQNLRKGTRGLACLLEDEVSDAFEERKNFARRCGEEAGTKMLFPMMIMFGIIIVIIMVPAMLSLQ